LALDNISLHIKTGERIGICGRTGSGKSTFPALLLRLLDPLPGSGYILIDAHDLSTISRTLIRSRINALSQEPFFLSSLSVRQNLDPYDTATRDECISVLQRVQLWDPIQAKGGLDGIIADSAGEEWLSQGQKQLFCLARALLRPGKVVVLDEMSSRSVFFFLFSFPFGSSPFPYSYSYLSSIPHPIFSPSPPD
jgi:ATP-binding cassette, subfamily C (CFTR/MRP), member 1